MFHLRGETSPFSTGGHVLHCLQGDQHLNSPQGIMFSFFDQGARRTHSVTALLLVSTCSARVVPGRTDGRHHLRVVHDSAVPAEEQVSREPERRRLQPHQGRRGARLYQPAPSGKVPSTLDAQTQTNNLKKICVQICVSRVDWVKQ